jgi:hypothetical protein
MREDVLDEVAGALSHRRSGPLVFSVRFDCMPTDAGILKAGGFTTKLVLVVFVGGGLGASARPGGRVIHEAIFSFVDEGVRSPAEICGSAGPGAGVL